MGVVICGLRKVTRIRPFDECGTIARGGLCPLSGLLLPGELFRLKSHKFFCIAHS